MLGVTSLKARNLRSGRSQSSNAPRDVEHGSAVPNEAVRRMIHERMTAFGIAETSLRVPLRVTNQGRVYVEDGCRTDQPHSSVDVLSEER